MEDIPESSSRPRRRPRRRDLHSKDGDGLDDDGADASDDGGYDGVPEVGMVFRTHQEVSRFYKRYARRVGFGVSVRRSSFTKDGCCLYLELICCKGGPRRPEAKFRKRTSATTDCPARLRVKLWGDGLLHLEHASLDHNHPVSPSMARFLSAVSKKRSNTETDPTSAPAPPEDRLTALDELLFGESAPSRCFVERGRLKLSDGSADALRLFLTRSQARNPSFFSVVDLDDDGSARNAFWADARSRASYRYYNDVVTIDTTCMTNKYDIPLAIFTGANHHGQPVLLGCALLSDETAETYVWLLKAWIACMSGVFPKAIITDYCKGVQVAVAEVLPGIRHGFCLFQVMKQVSEKLGGLAEYRAIFKVMQKAVYDSLRPDEFEDDWRGMVHMYGLHGNAFLSSLYDCRYSWAPVFLKDTFWAGMYLNQRNDTLHSYFDGYVDARTSLKQFLSKHGMALQSNYEKEAQADFETFHKRRPAVSKFYMEEQLSKVYTLNMFKKFQDEIEAIMYCHASVVTVDGAISTFDVKECIFLEDGKRTMNKNYGVLYNADEKDVQCICGSFQFRGILCRHALSVFKLKQVHEIPSKYILDRWKKDFKRLLVATCSTNDVVADNRVDRYDYLTTRCLNLVEVSMVSDKYQLALKLIREVEKFLLSDKTYDDTKPKVVSRVPKANKPDPNCNQNVGLIMPPANGNIRGVQGSLQSSKDGVNQSALPSARHFPTMNNQQQSIGNQASNRSVVYMFPGAFDPQALGNGSMMPWIYQQMLQASQQQTAVQAGPVQAAAKKRTTNRSRKPIEAQAAQKSQAPPPPTNTMENGS